MTSKEHVLSTLNFTNTEECIPRQLWKLPWANEHFPGKIGQNGCGCPEYDGRPGFPERFINQSAALGYIFCPHVPGLY